MPEENVESGTPNGGTPPAGDGTPNPAVAAAPASPPAPAPGAPPSGEDARQRGILADLQRERRARQELEARLRNTESQFTEAQRRVAALAGVNTPSAEEAEIEQVRAQFARIFPGLAKLTDEQIDRLMATAAQSQTLEQTVHHHWESHGRAMIESLTSEVSEALGGGTLTERQIKALSRAYVAEAENDPEFLKRHERGDKALIKEFAKQWVEDWYEPARRRVTAEAVNGQRRVPSGRDRSVSTTPPRAVDFKNPKAVEDAMVESFRSHGGRFGE